MAILVTGANGQLGSALLRRLGPTCIPCDRQFMNLSDPMEVEARIADLKPSVVINCAAYTHVDLAESNIDCCMKTNADVVLNLSKACTKYDLVFVQISTDYVFGGNLSRRFAYEEMDVPMPINTYGHSKLAGEQNAAVCRKHFIVRTCGLYGISNHSVNFVEKMLTLSQTQDRLRVVCDQHCSPTFVDELADAILFLTETSRYGLYNIVNTTPATWFEFALEILRQSNISIPVDPIKSHEFQTAAARPRYSVLDTTKYQSLGGPVMSDWRTALAKYLVQRKEIM